MNYLTDYSLKEQSPEDQVEVLESFEKDDEITVVLEEKGSISGPVTSVVENGPSGNPEEIHVQFLNFESNFRDDDMGHHTVSVTRSEDEEWERAELTYSWTDGGRVRKNTVGTVERIWPGLAELRRTTVLSHEEAQIVSLKEAGFTKQEMAEQWGCDETTIDAILGSIRSTYERAEQTIDRLESSPIDLDGRRSPATPPNSENIDWRGNSDQQTDSESK